MASHSFQASPSDADAERKYRRQLLLVLAALLLPVLLSAFFSASSIVNDLDDSPMIEAVQGNAD